MAGEKANVSFIGRTLRYALQLCCGVAGALLRMLKRVNVKVQAELIAPLLHLAR